MSLSRKNKRELKKLRKLVGVVLDEQRDVIDHAGVVLSEAGNQAKKLSNQHLLPRVAKAYKTVSPTVERGLANLIKFSQGLGDKMPPLAEQTVLRAINAANSTGNKNLAKSIRKFAEKNGVIKKRNTPGKTLAILAGIGVAAAVGYSLWQSFRDDEDIWLAPEKQ
ncbi:DNA/RNA helicase [Canibacter sp. lx-72]|uniref:DNA/RNA helicase n=1 Tax=Canibacter zhuwentaonis TaxID=2837491 RepID=UPI001BDBCFC2|nr:DNA/RNA helicase [Canibacter zhuwentaonis]MBT1018655.1 DNA/RNA helicase [Canibacter zhuwentaonis]MBT1035835.1 DNA/RNA helicase [Canibacter zhuwentaonis]